MLDRFDEIINYRGYSSRSEGIRDAIRSYIQHYKWMADVKGDRQGVITMIYDHDQRGLLALLTDIQHEFKAIIQASLHSHVTENRCLEVILLRGDGTQLKALAEEVDVTKRSRISKTDNDWAGGLTATFATLIRGFPRVLEFAALSKLLFSLNYCFCVINNCLFCFFRA